MKNKKIIIFLSIVFLGLGIFGYFFFLKEDRNSTLTLQEKKWIEKNKNDIIDLSISNNIPVFNYEGRGVFLDFIENLEGNTKLEFNKIADDSNKEYRFEITNDVQNDDIVFYKDNYVILTAENKKYDTVSAITPLAIGVMKDDLKNINAYLNNESKFLYKTYDDYTSLFIAMKSDMSGINAIAVPKNLYLKEILENNLHIAYQITDYQKRYVLKLGKNKTLNKILHKYYDKWIQEKYEKSYADHFSDSYFTFRNISEKEKSDFRSKRYVYGFVENNPFDVTYTGRLRGFNKEYIETFSKIANIEMKYQKYGTFRQLSEDFDNDNLDFIFDYSSIKKKETDTFHTVNNIETKVSILTTLENNKKIHSLESLKDEEVLVLKDTKIEKALKEKGITVKSYPHMKDLFKAMNKQSILALDSYHSLYNELENYRTIYEFSLNDQYGYVIRDKKANKIFENFFNFYISFVDGKIHMDHAIIDLLALKRDYKIVLDILLYILATIGVFFIVKSIIGLFIKPKEKNASMVRKEDKLKYIDRLTSLKNRNYLNDNITKWDGSDIYPQTIMIVDLNNIAYINDNYGHKEGDAVIESAANILINNQIINSEIIRTDGNEFLIYLVGYDEKQVVSYKKKLNKEFKELEHGYGAAIGYSMIMDAIKTIDDAINEATLDMKTVKEENNN